MRRKKGLTIIECLVSMIILATMLTAGMAFYFNAQASMRGSIHKRIAVEMAGAEMESLKNSGYASITLGVWPQSNISIGNLTGQRDVDVTDMSGYKKVRVVVSWDDPRKNSRQSVSLDTYIAP